MSRNEEMHFRDLPMIDKPRTVFDRSWRHPTSFNVGELVPIYLEEVLPGDTFKVRTNKLVRTQTPLFPVLDDAFLDTFYFWVPARLTWEHWQEFWGENNKSAWVDPTEYFVPQIKSPVAGWEPGTIADHMQVPVNIPITSGRAVPMALPFRAYALICDTFFRDQNLQDPLNIPLGDATQDGSNGSDYINDVANGGKPFIACKLHDYFTSCIPSPQKAAGPVVLPLGNYAPVKTFSDRILPAGSYPGIRLDTNSPVSTNMLLYRDGSTSQLGGVLKPEPTISDSRIVYPTNLGVDLSIATGASIEQLRLAFCAQGFYELDTHGTRYNEYLINHWGVTSPNGVLQMPEYLGGNRVRLNMEEVKNTAQTDKDFLGDVGGFSKTGDSNFDFVHSFTEHGFIIGLACVRYHHTYSQGLNRMWTRRDKFDYYDPIFANLGEQPVMSSEIYLDAAHQDDVFGYQEAWADYRFHPSGCSGELRPSADNPFAAYTYADFYDNVPTLSAGWIKEDLNNFDRTLAVSHTVANQIFGDFSFDVSVTREMPMYSIPALLGHM